MDEAHVIELDLRRQPLDITCIECLKPPWQYAGSLDSCCSQSCLSGKSQSVSHRFKRRLR